MAIHTSGLYSMPSGRVGGIVWGRARTRFGKLATSRSYTIPTYSDTPDQIAQRAKFREALRVCNILGSPIWQNPWDNTLGKLAGYSACMSHLVHNFNYALGTVSFKIPSIPKSLGPVYMPTIAVVPGPTTGRNSFTWDTACYGDHASPDDQLMGFRLNHLHPDWEGDSQILLPGVVSRSAGAWISDDAPLGSIQVYFALWFQHDPTASGPLVWSPVSQLHTYTGSA